MLLKTDDRRWLASHFRLAMALIILFTHDSQYASADHLISIKIAPHVLFDLRGDGKAAEKNFIEKNHNKLA